MKPRHLAQVLLAVSLLPVGSFAAETKEEKSQAKAFDIAGAAAKVDQLVEATLAKQGLKSNAEIDDPTFVRRAYLDIAGRVPTIEEAENFHGSDYPRKRQQLITDLLESEGHMSHAYNFWADVHLAPTNI